MGKAAESVVIPASVAEVWDFYFEPRTWPAWVDGFGGVDESDDYPAAGGTLRWHSTAAGRGEVTERVLEHEPRRLHSVEFSDPESSGTMTTRFEIVTGVTRTARAARGGPGSRRRWSTRPAAVARWGRSPTSSSCARRCSARSRARSTACATRSRSYSLLAPSASITFIAFAA